jgi:Xylose isomerase-like TIM barrel
LLQPAYPECPRTRHATTHAAGASRSTPSPRGRASYESNRTPVVPPIRERGRGRGESAGPSPDRIRGRRAQERLEKGKFLLSPVEFARNIDEFASPWVGAYFDVGNIVEYGYPEQWIRELGKRILKVHIKEYAKPKRFDYRLGEGEIDWNAVRTALLEVGYEGWITAEVGLGDLETMKEVVRRMNKLLLFS